MNELQHPFVAQAAGYHSPEDARRMQQLVQAMLADRRHLALTSPDPDTLAHYSRLLVRDLRQHPAVKVLPHLPSTVDVMLARFNELLADLPVDDVVDRRAPRRGPVQVFVVHDTPALSAEELALLVRLVNDLPGANLRLVLVQERDLSFTGSLHALGPQVLHWNILPPGVTPAQAASAERSRQALRAALRGASSDEAAALSGLRPSWMKAEPSMGSTPLRSSGLGTVGRSTPPARNAGKAAAPAGKTTAKVSAKKGAPAAGRESAGAASPAARRNWMLLTGGIAVSAALAIGLGTWITWHLPAGLGDPPARTAARSATPSR